MGVVFYGTEPNRFTLLYLIDHLHFVMPGNRTARVRLVMAKLASIDGALTDGYFKMPFGDIQRYVPRVPLATKARVLPDNGRAIHIYVPAGV